MNVGRFDDWHHFQENVILAEFGVHYAWFVDAARRSKRCGAKSFVDARLKADRDIDIEAVDIGKVSADRPTQPLALCC